ncbi:MAG: putative chromosome-partitioning protein ParB [marine bacterium B5-7]|nr:MAG: putative chromosome-partitioning protein ParB [marine bacterium B5-7]
MAKKSRLGRGLDALISPAAPRKPADAKDPVDATPGEDNTTQPMQGGPLELGIDELRRGRYQPRTHMDEDALEELAASIRSQGVVQPILVRQTATGDYEIIAGERRWRAARIAGLTHVPVVVRQVPDDAAMTVALIENIQREDLNPIEEAAGIKRLIDEFGLTHQDAADKVGRSRTAVSNLLRLLNLDPAVREHLEHGRIEMGHARALLALSRDAQEPACDAVMYRRLSVRQTEQLIRRMLTPAADTRNASKKPAKDSDIARLEGELSDKLGASVSIEQGAKRGRLVIEYHSLDELDGILSRIK